MLKSVKERECEGLKKEMSLLSNLSTFDHLLKDVYEHRRPTSTDYKKRRDLIRVFNEIARELYGNSDNCPVVEEFGSFLMDMFNASSDLDMSINFSKKSVLPARALQTRTLQKFARKLYSMRDQGRVTNVKPILSARVPVLKVTDCSSGVECDLSVENLDGIAKSKIVHLVSSIDARFQQLSFLIKDWAKAQGINSAKDGSLNSLSLILLSAFHLQTRDTPILPPFSAILKDGTDLVTVKESISTFMNYGENNKESIAELFVSLLIKLELVDKFWSEGLCVSTFQGSWIYRKWNSKDGPMLGCISIEDFTNRSQNASRALKDKTYMTIYSRIRSTLNQIRLFTEGKISAVELRNLLFGENPTLTSQVIIPVDTKKKKRKRFGEKKKKKHEKPESSRKRGIPISSSGRKAKSQRTSSGSRPTQITQGSHTEPLTYAGPNFMSRQSHSVSNLPFEDSKRFSHPENQNHAPSPFMVGPPHHSPYFPAQRSLGLSFHDYGGFRSQRRHDEGFSQAIRPPPSFSDRDNQRYVGYRRDENRVDDFRLNDSYVSDRDHQRYVGYRRVENRVDDFRREDTYVSRSYDTMPSYHHYPPCSVYRDRERWERSYAPHPSFPSQYLRDSREFEDRHWRR